jgi:vacuolar-type H+-ATPase catalytic subunit A/Vma1
LDESIISDSVFEQEDFERRKNSFSEYSKYINAIRQYREEDSDNRAKEKIHQLEEYINLQAKIDQIRRIFNEPREAFRQRFLEIERQRLEELAVQQQKLIEEEKAKAAAMIKPIKKKTSAGKKKKK